MNKRLVKESVVECGKIISEIWEDDAVNLEREKIEIRSFKTRNERNVERSNNIRIRTREKKEIRCRKEGKVFSEKRRLEIGKMKCMYANVNGIWGKRAKVESLVIQEDIDIFMATETKILMKKPEIKGYEFKNYPRKKSDPSGGGELL